ncbi:MAG: right-handed parallel beta-helix repeat-containing protein [Spirochaetaceae bacterium]|nr:MAG: right-handed parallel beta-helix repeat-containing protein [Spirochaetaceae bacterium]
MRIFFDPPTRRNANATRVCLAIGLVLLGFVSPVSATTFYVSASGNDSAAGTCESTAWRTMQRVQAHAWTPGFRPGDRILFEGGRRFEGDIYLQLDRSFGSPEQPLVIGSYGRGRATLVAPHGKSTILAWAPPDGRVALGLAIHDLNVIAADGDSHGIIVWNGSRSPLDHLRIERVDVSGAGRDGVSIGRDSPNHGFIRDVVIRHVRAYENPGTSGWHGPSGSGIVVGGTQDGLVEYSVAHHNGANNTNSAGPVGIWTWDSERVVIQFSESYENRTQAGDGGGFDIDGGTKDCVIQFCYSHNNAGPGYLFAQFDDAAEMSGNHIRYNISVNDGRKGDTGAIHVWGHRGNSGFRSGYVYNNVVYMEDAPTGVNFGIRAWDRFTGLVVANNVFYLSGERVHAVSSSRTSEADAIFVGNAYYSTAGPPVFRWGARRFSGLGAWAQATGQETRRSRVVGLERDPGLEAPGEMPTFGDPCGLRSLLPSLVAYRLEPGSPLIDAGLDLRSEFGIDPGTRDFFGNRIPVGRSVAIGIHEPPR